MPLSPDACRNLWVALALRVTKPVFSSLAREMLRASMPVESLPGSTDRPLFSHLEAVGRSLAGISPWLAVKGLTEKEKTAQNEMLELVLRGLRNCVAPASPDRLNFANGNQPLVDAAFLVQGMLRAHDTLWPGLDGDTQSLLLKALSSTRHVKPPRSNWLLFSAMVEAFLYRVGAPWQREPIDLAVREHEAWYQGDGVYGDGPAFHWDYYNSFVIQPMLLEILDVMAPEEAAWFAMRETVLARARRFAEVQERFVAPDGSFPVIGRSIAYRCGAFQSLAQMAWREQLPQTLDPGQAREALTAVIRRTLEAPGTFDENNWLQIGLAGHQPSLAEPYISTGSLYLCSAVFLPLGLPPSAPFWLAASKPWTSCLAWSGKDLPSDHALTP